MNLGICASVLAGAIGRLLSGKRGGLIVSFEEYERIVERRYLLVLLASVDP